MTHNALKLVSTNCPLRRFNDNDVTLLMYLPKNRIRLPSNIRLIRVELLPSMHDPQSAYQIHKTKQKTIKLDVSDNSASQLKSHKDLGQYKSSDLKTNDGPVIDSVEKKIYAAARHFVWGVRRVRTLKASTSSPVPHNSGVLLEQTTPFFAPRSQARGRSGQVIRLPDRH